MYYTNLSRGQFTCCNQKRKKVFIWITGRWKILVVGGEPRWFESVCWWTIGKTSMFYEKSANLNRSFQLLVYCWRYRSTICGKEYKRTHVREVLILQVEKMMQCPAGGYCVSLSAGEWHNCWDTSYHFDSFVPRVVLKLLKLKSNEKPNALLGLLIYFSWF